jgi:hypothetical protein
VRWPPPIVAIIATSKMNDLSDDPDEESYEDEDEISDDEGYTRKRQPTTPDRKARQLDENKTKRAAVGSTPVRVSAAESNLSLLKELPSTDVFTSKSGKRFVAAIQGFGTII